jgi:alcohol dehydrogenase, propanol-preferring
MSSAGVTDPRARAEGTGVSRACATEGNASHTGSTMTAWAVTGRPSRRDRLAAVERAVPEPAGGEILIEVSVCGVCRTDLHLADGDLPARAPATVPGHEVVGTVAARGKGANRFQVGDRVGAAWLRRTCGSCHACRTGNENLCRRSEYTGWDVDGGFAEYLRFPEAFAYRMPDVFDDTDAAPLLCSGIIGYRALNRAAVPPGGRLGIYGFGASGHLTAQLALARGAEVHVLTREPAARQLATRLGAASIGPAYGRPPVPLDSAILFAPVGDLVPFALAALDQGGTLAIAGIHLTEIPRLDYQLHLFRERNLTSVTANTRADGEELLRLAANLGLRPQVTDYSFEHVDEALDDVARGRVTGAAAVRVRD